VFQEMQEISFLRLATVSFSGWLALWGLSSLWLWTTLLVMSHPSRPPWKCSWWWRRRRRWWWWWWRWWWRYVRAGLPA